MEQIIVVRVCVCSARDGRLDYYSNAAAAANMSAQVANCCCQLSVRQGAHALSRANLGLGSPESAVCSGSGAARQSRRDQVDGRKVGAI